MRYAIYPPIGVARIGNSPDGYFIAPEQPGSLGTEIDPDGAETRVTAWKDTMFRIKRQVSRFHLFEIPDDGSEARPAQLPPGSTVRWKVRLVNKKDAIVRPPEPPPAPIAVTADAARQDRIIDSGDQSVAGPSAPRAVLSGTYRTQPVKLGEVWTDGSQRLLVAGGVGLSRSPVNAPIGTDFYNNPDWHDDVSDGPVSATVEIPGSAPAAASPAWLIVAPPDFAPSAFGVVTLYDVILQVAYDQGWLTPPASVSFETDIRPMLERAASLRYVSNNPEWSKISGDWASLSNPAASTRLLRVSNAALIKAAETVLNDFTLRPWQRSALDAWTAGTFGPAARQASPTAALTRTILDSTVGQGFFPGIEAGVILTNSALYLREPFEFRLDPTKVAGGDLTALMALPWQADFLKCSTGWWPAQRPDVVPQLTGPALKWQRPVFDHRDLVLHAMQLGVVSPQHGGVIAEGGRDPAIGP
jgi:L-Lysine epsilon oxidase N-terminal/L-lysine epsilon oxidase C-terminal domain